MFFSPSLAKGKQLTLVEMKTYFKKIELLKIEGEEFKKRVLKVSTGHDFANKSNKGKFLSNL